MKTLLPSDVAQLFLRPRRNAEIAALHPFPHARKVVFNFNHKKLVAWEAGAGPVILLIHGWQRASADMREFVAPLCDAGFSVIAVDFPAHGASEGTSVSLIDFINALRCVLSNTGSIHAVIAHSVGCLAIAEILKSGLSINAAVLISPLARYLDVAQKLCAAMGFDRNGTMQMLNALRVLGVDVASFDTLSAVKSLHVPALIIHSDDDKIIPPKYGREVAEAWPNSKFMQVHGLGHQKILSAPNVVDAATSFVIQDHTARTELG